MNKNREGLCQLCSREPGVHQFHGRISALIGETCLARANAIRDDAMEVRFARVAGEIALPPNARMTVDPRTGLHRRRSNGKWIYETASERRRRLAHVSATRKSRAMPQRLCKGCEQPIVRVARKGPIPKWCDACNPFANRRRHAVPVGQGAELARRGEAVA